MRAWLLAAVLAGCAAPVGLASGPDPNALVLQGSPDAELPRLLVGRWEGEVDLAMAERTLLIQSLRRQDGRWVARALYGTTNVNLTPTTANVEVVDGRVVVSFVTHLTSRVRLTLHRDDRLVGAFRLATDARERAMDLRRVSTSPEPAGSTAMERLAQRGAGARPAAEPAAETTGPGPLPASSLRAPAAELPPLLVGRWEGEVELSVPSRVLVVESVAEREGKWVVDARYGISDHDLTPLPAALEIAGDRIHLRFVTELASRVSLTLHRDRTLRGSFALVLDARDRKITLRKVSDAPTTAAAGAGPQVTLASPADGARGTESSAALVGVVTAARGVREVLVTLNGAEVLREQPATPRPSIPLNAPLPLREGANTLAVTATDAGGAIRQVVRTLTQERAAPAAAVAAAPAPAAPAVRETWAVVIGIGRYDSQAVPALRYAVADAEAIHRTLVGPGGLKPERVLLLTDRTERKPTLRNLRWALGTFLARAAGRDDTVLIFFAGHGAPETDLRNVERDGLAKYLIPADADPEDLYATALPMDEIRTIFERIEAERVVAFFDTCYSGAAGGRTFASARTRTRAVTVDDLFLERLARSRGRAIMTASRPAEVSLELPELAHGIFTYFLVQGLGGAADLDRDGIVSLHELYVYVEQQVSRKSREVGGNQHPVLKGEVEGALPLVRVRR
jgi:hypothetical protein